MYVGWNMDPTTRTIPCHHGYNKSTVPVVMQSAPLTCSLEHLGLFPGLIYTILSTCVMTRQSIRLMSRWGTILEDGEDMTRTQV